MTYALARVETLTVEALSRASRHGRGADKASQRRRRPEANERARYLRRGDDGAFVHELPKQPKTDDAGKQPPTDAVRRLLAGFGIKHEPEAVEEAEEATKDVKWVAPPAADLLQEHRRHLKREKAGLRKGAAVAMHLQLGVTPEWLGNARFDPKSELVVKLMDTATAFVEREFGGVFAARFDVDEESGGGIADVFAAPIRANARSGRKVVSVRKSIQALKAKAKRPGKPPRPFTVLQDLWHQECVSTLDSRIQRGERGSEAVHRDVESYKLIQKLELSLDQHKQSLDQLGRQAATAVAAFRQRFRQAGASQEALDGDPLFRLLDRVVAPGLPAKEYRRLAAAIEAQLKREREAQLKRERSDREERERAKERSRWQR